MDFVLTFLKTFFTIFYLTLPLLLFIMLVITFLGQIVGRIESWKKFDALYWSFITATTVGYGDIRPLTRTSKVLSVFIALTGIVFTGIVVAVAVQSVTYAFTEHIDLAQLKEALHK